MRLNRELNNRDVVLISSGTIIWSDGTVNTDSCFLGKSVHDQTRIGVHDETRITVHGKAIMGVHDGQEYPLEIIYNDYQ